MERKLVQRTFLCPKCNRTFTSKAYEGENIKCNDCGTKIPVLVKEALQDPYDFSLFEFLFKFIPILGLIRLNVPCSSLRAFADYEIGTVCPRCRKTYVVHGDYKGATAECQKCSMEFTIEPQELPKYPPSESDTNVTN